jgi:2TM domain-containing protein
MAAPRVASIYRDTARKDGTMLRAGEESIKDQEQRRYEQAHARVQAIKGFYVHAVAFVMVNVALIALNALVGGVWWFYWPLIGWGIGLGVHALAVFGFGGGGPWGREWEERKTREMMDKERGR